MTIKIKKFGDILTSRPAGREAALVTLAYESQIKNAATVTLDFEGVKVLTPSWLGEFLNTLVENKIKNIQYQNTSNPTVSSSIEILSA